MFSGLWRILIIEYWVIASTASVCVGGILATQYDICDTAVSNMGIMHGFVAWSLETMVLTPVVARVGLVGWFSFGLGQESLACCVGAEYKTYFGGGRYKHCNIREYEQTSCCYGPSWDCE